MLGCVSTGFFYGTSLKPPSLSWQYKRMRTVGQCPCIRLREAVASIRVLVTSLFSVPSIQGLKKKAKENYLKNDHLCPTLYI